MSTARYLLIITIPFAIGASFHYFGAWVGLPALLVGGLFWVAAIATQYKKECEDIEGKSP